MWDIRYLVILLCLNIVFVNAADTFTNIPTCSMNDESINDCLLKVFQTLIPLSKNAIPELNLPSMDPFHVNRTSYSFSHPVFKGKFAVRDVKIHGLSKLNIKNLKYERKGKEVSVKTEFALEKMFVEGFYKAKVLFNAANITARGPFNMTFTNITGTAESIGDLFEKDGHTYMHYKAYNHNPTVGNMIFKADGLMPEPLLNDAILEFVNQNWRSVYKPLVRETHAAWEPEFVRLANEYFSHVPVDVVLKE